jgi:hypothetical protein
MARFPLTNILKIAWLKGTGKSAYYQPIDKKQKILGNIA